jgi:hypothetical protein
MAERVIKGRNQVEGFALCKAHAAEALDTAVKDLIDNLLIPYLVEEFLRLHGPAATGKQKLATATSSPDLSIQS